MAQINYNAALSAGCENEPLLANIYYKNFIRWWNVNVVFTAHKWPKNEYHIKNSEFIISQIYFEYQNWSWLPLYNQYIITYCIMVIIIDEMLVNSMYFNVESCVILHICLSGVFELCLPDLLLRTSTTDGGKKPTRSVPRWVSWMWPFHRPSECCSRTWHRQIMSILELKKFVLLQLWQTWTSVPNFKWQSVQYLSRRWQVKNNKVSQDSFSCDQHSLVLSCQLYITSKYACHVCLCVSESSGHAFKTIMREPMIWKYTIYSLWLLTKCLERTKTKR